MQTFLPYPNFAESARVLDQKRLGKQRVETFQIIQRLVGLRLISYFTYNTGEWVWIDRDENPDNSGWEPVVRRVDLPERAWSFAPVKTAGWDHHPAVEMWRGHEHGLLDYQYDVCEEWLARGYSDTCWRKTLAVFEQLPRRRWTEPPWLGDQDFHISHQSNLVAKDPGFYRPIFPDVPDDLEYLWPGPSQERRINGTRRNSHHAGRHHHVPQLRRQGRDVQRRGAAQLLRRLGRRDRSEDAR